jgi:hypothetical protein
MKVIGSGIAAALLVACVAGVKADSAISQLPTNDDVISSIPAVQSTAVESTGASTDSKESDSTIVLVKQELPKVEQQMSPLPTGTDADEVAGTLELMSQSLLINPGNDQQRSDINELNGRINAALAKFYPVTRGPGGGMPGGGGHMPVGPAPFHPQPGPAPFHPQPSPQPHPQPMPHPQPAPQPHPQPMPHPQPGPMPHPQPIPPFHPYPGLRCTQQDGVIDYDNCGSETPWHCYAQFSDGDRSYGACVSDVNECYSYGPDAVPCYY